MTIESLLCVIFATEKMCLTHRYHDPLSSQALVIVITIHTHEWRWVGGVISPIGTQRYTVCLCIRLIKYLLKLKYELVYAGLCLERTSTVPSVKEVRCIVLKDDIGVESVGYDSLFCLTPGWVIWKYPSSSSGLSCIAGQFKYPYDRPRLWPVSPSRLSMSGMPSSDIIFRPIWSS